MALTSVGTDLYVGGIFGVEKYDTVAGTWATLGTGLTDADACYCNSLAVIGDKVYAVGQFDDAGGTAVNNLAAWDTVGSAWEDVGGGVTVGEGYVLLASGALLYIGGSLTQVGGALAVSKVCTWNTGTTSFAALDAGLDGAVYALAVYGSNILAGGAFTGKISEWDGAAWAVFGGGLNNTVRGIAVYLTDVSAVGLFTDAGNRIARYSGGGWTALGTGLNNNGYTIALIDDDVYVGGTFTTAGDKPAIKLAAYFNNFESLMDYLENSSINGFDMGAAIHNAPASAVTDSDEFPFWEDVANKLRKITWANIKATLKTYFDALYVAIAQGVNNALMITSGAGNVTALASSSDASQYLGGDLAWHDIPSTTHLYLDATNSDLASHETLTVTVPADPEATIAVSCASADTLIAQYADTADLIPAIIAQSATVHVHLAKTAGVKNVTVYAKLFVYHSDTSETLIGTSGSTGNLAGTSTAYNLEMSLAALTFAAGDRRILRFYGTPNGTGTDPTATIYYEGTTNSHMELGTTAAGGSGTPGGSDTQVQFNDGGSFGGDAGFTYDKTNNAASLGTLGATITATEGALRQGASGASVAHFLESFDTGIASFVTLIRGRGTAASPTAVQADDVIGRIRGRAFDDATAIPANTSAEMALVANQTHTTSAHGTRVEIYTTPDGNTTLTKAFTVGNDGNVNIETGKTYNINGSPHTHAGSGDKYPFEARLTLETGVPVSTTDQSAKTEVFLTQYKGDQVAIYDGSSTWSNLALGADISIKTTNAQTGTTTSGNAVISGLTDTSQLAIGMTITGTGVGAASVIATIDSATQVTGTVNSTASASVTVTFKTPAASAHDIFVIDSSGSLKLEYGVKWNSATTRFSSGTYATLMPKQNGVKVKSTDGTNVDTTRRYAGTIYSETAGQVDVVFGQTAASGGSAPKLYIYNEYNQVPGKFTSKDSTATWSYSGGAHRAKNNSTGNSFKFINGGVFTASGLITCVMIAAIVDYNAVYGVGLDSTSSENICVLYFEAPRAGRASSSSNAYNANLPLGYHYLQEIERTFDTNVVFQGYSSGSWQSGCTYDVMM